MMTLDIENEIQHWTRLESPDCRIFDLSGMLDVMSKYLDLGTYGIMREVMLFLEVFAD